MEPNDQEINQEISEISEPNKEEAKTQDKEQLIEALHNKARLQQLRTYQGDVADFIQSKDRSLADIAIKNKEEKSKREDEEKIHGSKNYLAVEMPYEKVAKSRPTNILIYAIGGALLLGAVSVISYILYAHFKNLPVEVNIATNTVVRSNRAISLDLTTFNKKNFEQAIAEAKASGDYNKGISGVQIPSSNNTSFTAREFIQKMGWQMPGALLRSLGAQFLPGLYGDGQKAQFFIIFTENDYGIAFRDMLAWESDLPSDLAPLVGLDSASTSEYQFRDVIVKNKDAREFSDAYGKTAIVYTFLNQNTILITESESAMSQILNSFAVGNEVR